jgi:SSS family solute:Na+ symporter
MVASVARALVPGVALVAIFLTLRGGSELVPLLLMGYSLVTQLFPALILSIGRRQLASSAGAFTGILAGELTVAYLTISGATLATLLPAAPQVVKDLNVGLVALLVNIAVMTAVSAVTRRSVADPVLRSAEG